MRKLLNTLYVNTPDCYLALQQENVCVLHEEETLMRVPLLNLEGIMTFGYTGASPALMHACAERGIALSFMTPSGQFLAGVHGEVRGNITLRKQQYRISTDEAQSALYARNFIFGKLYNAKWILERAARDYPLRLDAEKLKAAAAGIAGSFGEVTACEDLGILRGIEGKAATLYFGEFDSLILQNRDKFHFEVRSRRPPTDPVNAMLSFAYALLARDCQAALTAVGLDAYAGFLHRDRPGRASLALDLMEELRGVMADRFVLTQINLRGVSPSDFTKAASGAVSLKDDARKAFLSAWQNRKQETLTHPFLGEKLEWGLVPHAQALLLARAIRGDLDAYPPFLWK
ncbi:MAG: type I-C CRISPR-associated endonuclease Cas1c [Oscillospiraceae bacterium]|jgi:CRISPR-associated protein Cas1|nr:type I-C CRISPR-associated endonuclease Cas1c [Oscillospiraceae bacterium]